MKKDKLFKSKSIFITLIILLLGGQSVFGQDSFTSIAINFKNFTLSADSKTISYDVYLKDIDPVNVCACPAFTLVIPLMEPDSQQLILPMPMDRLLPIHRHLILDMEELYPRLKVQLRCLFQIQLLWLPIIQLHSLQLTLPVLVLIHKLLQQPRQPHRLQPLH